MCFSLTLVQRRSCWRRRRLLSCLGPSFPFQRFVSLPPFISPALPLRGAEKQRCSGCRVRLGKPQLAPAGPRLKFADSALVEDGDDDEAGQVFLSLHPCSYWTTSRESKDERVCSPLYVATGLPLEVALHSGSFSGLLQVQVQPRPIHTCAEVSASRDLQAGVLGAGVLVSTMHIKLSKNPLPAFSFFEYDSSSWALDVEMRRNPFPSLPQLQVRLSDLSRRFRIIFPKPSNKDRLREELRATRKQCAGRPKVWSRGGKRIHGKSANANPKQQNQE